MHLSTKRRVVLGISTGGLLVGGLGLGIAQADTAANGGAADSPGLLSGNLIQIPVNAPVNVCGNSISVIGILDTATGSTCVNSGSNAATANGGAKDSPGAGSGNLIQIPVNAPINLCGNSASGVGVGDSATDNTCSNGSSPHSGGSGSGSGSGSGANGGSHGSPGAGSGNTVQLPVNAPVNVCGNSVSVIGILDTAANNTCSNTGSGDTTPPPPPCGCPPVPPPPPGTTPPPPIPTPPPTGGRPHSPFPPHHIASGGSTVRSGSLAETGTGAGDLFAPLGAGVLGGTGLMLRRRVSTLHNHVGSRKS